MKYILFLLTITLLYSCTDKELDKDYKLLISGKWTQVYPKASIHIGNLSPFPVECPDSLCPYNPSIVFNPDARYIRELYYNTAGPFQLENLQFLRMSGTWKKEGNSIFLLPANIYQIDDLAINEDSMFFINPSFIRGSRICNKITYDSLIIKNDLIEKWEIKSITDDSLVLISFMSEYKFRKFR